MNRLYIIGNGFDLFHNFQAIYKILLKSILILLRIKNIYGQILKMPPDPRSFPTLEQA